VDGAGSGPAGDGTFIRRFRNKADAERCAMHSTCWGQPARVITADGIPRRLLDRWGL
jgi:hypothetical protein